MKESFLKFFQNLYQGNVHIDKPEFDKIMPTYKFIFSPDLNIFNAETKEIYLHFHKAKFMFVYFHAEYFYIGFKKIILIFNYSSFSLYNKFFLSNPNIKACFFECQQEFYEKFPYSFHEIPYYNSFGVHGFGLNFQASNQLNSLSWDYILKFFEHFYFFTNIFNNKDRIEHFSPKKTLEEIPDMNSLLKYTHSLFISYNHDYAVYKDKLVQYVCTDKKHFSKLVKKCLYLRHPLINNIIALSEKIKKGCDNDIYILSETYRENEIHLDDNTSFSKRLTNIFELMLVIEYFHNNQLIFRFLSCTFDFRRIKLNEDYFLYLVDGELPHFKDIEKGQFNSEYTAPEVENSEYSYECDIYSIGKIMYTIFGNELSDSKIYDICSKCTKTNPKERPNISQLVTEFYLYFHDQMDIKKLRYVYNKYPEHFVNSVFNNPSIDFKIGTNYFNLQKKEKAIYYLTLAAGKGYTEAHFLLAALYADETYEKKEIMKAIYYLNKLSNQNHIESQYKLGLIYYEGKDVQKNMDKSIHYFSLAAKQNHIESQYKLGLIYYENKNINKSIHYLSLAANQNYIESQYKLGLIYYEDKNINKSIHYFSLAAKQNHIESQYKLGLIYYEDKNINKSIHYFSLAANQKHIESQFCLGALYFELKDIKKSIYFYSLSADQNHVRAQFNLGMIYLSNQYVTCDINKSIFYLTLASNQNCSEAQYNLGIIYSTNEFVEKNINQAIYYYDLAAKQNNVNAQYNLGSIYYEGKDVQKDINKTFYYYDLAAKQNYIKAQVNLGLIYYEGKYVLKNVDKAIFYLSFAANQNDQKAQLILGKIYFEKKDIEKAIHYFLLSANQNNPESQFYLGFLYYSNDFGKNNNHKATYYFSLAANQGHQDARAYLDSMKLTNKC